MGGFFDDVRNGVRVVREWIDDLFDDDSVEIDIDNTNLGDDDDPPPPTYGGGGMPGYHDPGPLLPSSFGATADSYGAPLFPKLPPKIVRDADPYYDY